MGGIFEGESTLELAYLDTEEVVLLPLGKEVDKHDGWVAGAGIRRSLKLNAPGYVTYLTIKDEAEQTQVESIFAFVIRVLSLILENAVSTELDVFYPLRQLNGGRLLFFLCIGCQCKGH